MVKKNKRMMNLFIWIGLIGGIMVVVSLFGYRKYSGKTSADNFKDASTERDYLKSQADTNAKTLNDSISKIKTELLKDAERYKQEILNKVNENNKKEIIVESFPRIEYRLTEEHNRYKLIPVIIVEPIEKAKPITDATISIIQAKYVEWNHNPKLFEKNDRFTIYADLDNDIPPFYLRKGEKRIHISSIIRSKEGIFNQSTIFELLEEGNLLLTSEAVYKEVRESSKPILYSKIYIKHSGEYATKIELIKR